MSSAQHVDTRWFQNMLADKRLSQRKMASMLGLDPAAVSLMLRGRRKLSAKEAAEIARLLNVGVDEVLARSGAGAPSKGRIADNQALAAATRERDEVVKDVKTITNAGERGVGAIGNDAEFLMRWMELGNYLLNRR